MPRDKMRVTVPTLLRPLQCFVSSSLTSCVSRSDRHAPSDGAAVDAPLAVSNPLGHGRHIRRVYVIPPRHLPATFPLLPRPDALPRTADAIFVGLSLVVLLVIVVVGGFKKSPPV